MSKMQDLIDEVRALSEYDRLKHERTAYIEDENILFVDGALIGKMSELPLWAQAYIKDLRAKVWDAKG